MKENDLEVNGYSVISNEDSKAIIEMSADVMSDMMAMTDMQASDLLSKSKEMMNVVVEYKELMMMYTCAMKEIRTKFDVLNTEFNVRYQRNPIKFINTRLKRTTSLADKMDRMDIPFSLDNIEEHIHDVAGIRVICSYVDDIYVLAKTLIQQDDIELIAKKDYIAKPKPNGYRSLHLIVSVPVFFADQTKRMKVEVQIRTIAMDFWASLEHQIKYKQEIEEEQAIVRELKDCADIIADTDARMLDLRKRIETNNQEQTEDEILFEKLSKIDMSFE